MRFADILTTAAAVTSYLGEDEVCPRHVLDAVAVLAGEKEMAALGRGSSPLLPRPPGGGGVQPPLRELVRAWFARLGNDASAALDGGSLAEFVADVRALEGAG